MRSHSFVMTTAFALAVGLTACNDGQLARCEFEPATRSGISAASDGMDPRVAWRIIPGGVHRVTQLPPIYIYGSRSPAPVTSPSVLSVARGKEKARRLGRSAGVAGLLETMAHDGVFIGSAIGVDATTAIDEMVASLGRPAPRQPDPVTSGGEPALTAMKLDHDR